MSIHSEFALCILMATTLDALTHDSKLVNSAVLVGDPIFMICESMSPNDKIWWKFRNSKVTGEKALYNGSHTYGEGFSVINTSKTALILTKKAANVDDSGIYSCIIKTDIKGTITYTAELIVFDLVCSSSIANNSVVNEGTIIELWCEIVFFEIVVNSSVVTWFRGDDERVPFENIIKANDALRSNATLQMTAKDEGLIVSFMLHFGQPHTNSSQQQSIVRATNAPEFKFRWNFHAEVSYGPRNISIENLKTSYEYGDTLVCHAEGNPLTYGWNSTATGKVKQGEKFTIPKELTAGISHPYVCVVVNKLLGTTAYKAINITVNEAGIGWNPMKITTVAMGVIASILVIVLLTVRSFPLKGDENHGPDIVRYADNNDDPVVLLNGGHEGLYAEPEELVHGRGAEANVRDDPNVVYAQVDKTSNGYTMRSQQPKATSSNGFPLYAEVDKTCSETTVRTKSGEKIHQNPRVQVTNTEYLDMNTARALIESPRTPKDSLFNRSEYASIDHTAPEPPSSYKDF